MGGSHNNHPKTPAQNKNKAAENKPVMLLLVELQSHFNRKKNDM